MLVDQDDRNRGRSRALFPSLKWAAASQVAHVID